MSASHLYLVLGGARSGKSRHAETLIETLPKPWHYVATAQAFDDEMRERIWRHRERREDGWRTLEAPVELAASLDDCPPGEPVLVDCLTLWLTNLMLGDHDVASAVEALMAALKKREGTTVLVSNEVGLGIVPENRLARAFRDDAGALHARLAAAAQSVHFLVAGIPTIIKEPT